jgi:uncharacterized protein (TIRG00374 family)
MKKTGIRLTLAFLLTAIFLFFFFRSVKDWGEVWRSLTRANVAVFCLFLALTPVHFVTRAFRWKYLLIHEKKDVKFYNLFAGNVIGFTVSSLLPGRVGEIVKPLYVARKENVRSGYAIGTIVVERIFDIFTMCFLLGVFFLARPLYESSFKVPGEAYSNLYRWGVFGVVFASVLLVLSLLFYFFKEKALEISARILKLAPRKFAEKILILLHEFIDGLKFFHSLGNLLTYIGLSFVVWLGIIFVYWVFLLAYNVTIPYFFLIPYIFLTMVGASIPTPGMVGGFHYFSILGLTLLYDIDSNLAAGMTIVVHAVQLAMTCLIGYVILWKEGLTLIQLRKLGETIEP